MTSNSNNLIVKNVIYTGNKNVTFNHGTKVIFHFKTTKCDDNETVIDDSRVMGKPMELVIGKKFKLEVWETIVQMMSLNEVSRFRVDKSLVSPYPFVSKTLRELDKPESEKINKHCCGVTLQNEGIGYEDLNDLIKNPQDLIFTIELINVIQSDEYEKQIWQMTESERFEYIPVLREKGNKFFKEKNYDAALEAYKTAIGIVEQLMILEKPRDEEWMKLNKIKTPLLLNYAQCKLLKKEYYEVVEHCTTVLEIEPDNVKALYRRGKAHIGVWNQTEASRDLMKAAELDPTLKSIIEKELKNFQQALKQKEKSERKSLNQMFSS
ncbi:AH receptor-interacting protein [Chelonus insularis]|uniref:AH receptor-interacting protein n=1 Tax=Chelonus insularis TaxID=460826 RepID=UPI001589F00A|nr:AH receptor-interacting protein [Chelonus insularis]